MAGRITLDNASDRQLRLLLGLDQRGVEFVRERRPITSKLVLRSLPGVAMERIGEGLEIERLDLNTGEARFLAETARIEFSLANLIVANRPYYAALELRGIRGMNPDAFARVTAYFAPRPLNYVDKLTGRSVGLSPDASRLLVSLRNNDAETAAAFRGRHSLPKARVSRVSSGYAVVQVAESEGGIDKINELKADDLVDYVVPVFQRSIGDSVFLDPKLCVAQFHRSTSETRVGEVLERAQLQILERHRTPGLLTLTLSRDDRNPVSIMEALRVLNGDPDVEFAEPAYVALNDLESATTSRRAPVANHQSEAAALSWNLELVGIGSRMPPLTGSADVVIAIIDTGVDLTHPAFSSAVLRRPQGESWNFEDDANPDPTDVEGHGTFIAGLIVGRGAMESRGVAVGCSILPLRVPLTGTSPSYARRRDAILYALEFVQKPRRLVINLSWKTTGDVSLIRDAVDQAVTQGALVVSSAGNWPNAENEPHFPSDYTDCISVGAVGPDGRRASYSYFGREIDLMAPGGSGSDDPAENLSSAQPGGGYGYDFGTSYASPHVAGAAALALSRQPNLTVAAVRQALQDGASSLIDTGSGYGLLNVPATLDRVTDSSVIVDNTGQLDGLTAVNTYDLDRLREAFGLMKLTARLIVARRPFETLAGLIGTLGLSVEQYDRIVSYHVG